MAGLSLTPFPIHSNITLCNTQGCLAWNTQSLWECCAIRFSGVLFLHLRQHHCNPSLLILVSSSVCSALGAPCTTSGLPDPFCKQLHIARLLGYWARAWASFRYSSLWSLMQESERGSAKRKKCYLLQTVSPCGHQTRTCISLTMYWINLYNCGS